MKRTLQLFLAGAACLVANLPLAQAAAPSSAQSPGHFTPAVSKKPQSCSSKNTVLLLEDEYPWGNSANEEVLSAIGVNFITANSDQFKMVLAPSRLAKCHTVIVASVQPSSFYTALQPYMKNLMSWVLFPQHTLVFHGADYGAWEGEFWNFALPLNLTHTPYTSNYNTVANPGSPLAQGLPSYFTGNYASHDVFDLGAVGSSNVVLQTNTIRGDTLASPQEAGPGGQATMVDYCYVLGRIIASTTTTEYSFANGYDWAVTLLWNELWLATKKPGCQPNAVPPPPPDYLYGGGE